jgi:hypothetical protein
MYFLHNAILDQYDARFILESNKYIYYFDNVANKNILYTSYVFSP